MTFIKTFLVFLFILMFNKKTECQTALGIQGGVSSNHLSTNISNRTSTTINNETSYTIGIPFQYKLTYWFYIQATPNSIQKNYTVKRTDTLSGVYAQYNNTYLQLPIMGHFVFGKRWQVFANAGIYLGYWYHSQIKGNIPDIFSASDTVINNEAIENYQLTRYNQIYIFNTQKDRRLESGWVTGTGFQYKFNSYAIFAECSYYQSLTDQQKKYMINQIPKYNETITFSFGCLYLFK